MSNITVELIAEDLDNSCFRNSDIVAKYGPDTEESVCTTCILAETLKRTGLVPKPYVSSFPWKVCDERWNSVSLYRIGDGSLLNNFDMARSDPALMESLRDSLPQTVVLTKE